MVLTTPRHAPDAMPVPANSMHSLACGRGGPGWSGSCLQETALDPSFDPQPGLLRSSQTHPGRRPCQHPPRTCSSHSSAATGAVVLATATLSPVSAACSTRSTAVRSTATRMSAGTLSPVWISTTSPGTSSRAGRSEIWRQQCGWVGGCTGWWVLGRAGPAPHACRGLPRSSPSARHPGARTSWPSRKTFAVSAVISLSASSADSALLSCHTPTAAFSTRISTCGSGV